MISYVVYFFFKKIFVKETFFLKIIYEILSITFPLGVIYFASKSFSFGSGVQNIESNSIFTFLLIGEVALALPMSFSEKYLMHFTELRNSQFYQTLLGLKISPFKIILGKTLIDSMFPLFRILIIFLVSSFIPGFIFSMFSFFLFLILQVFATVIFLLMAVITSLIVLRFNRGLGFFFTLQSLSAVIGGAYFPTSVFPDYIKTLASFLPQTQILSISRVIFNTRNIALDSLVILGFIPVILALVLVILRRYFEDSLRKRARYF